MKRLITLTVLAAAFAVPCIDAHAQSGASERALADDNTPWQSGGYFSWRLGARFELQQIQIPGYRFVAVRIVSVPVPGSPLYQLGLTVGDVITRLDGTRIVNYNELDRHHRLTYVRYIKAGTCCPVNRQLWIPNYTVFSDVQNVIPGPSIQSP